MYKDHLAQKNMWLKFIRTGEIDENVKPYVAESWKRSRAYGVNPYSEGIGKKTDEENIRRIINENAYLISVAKPIMRNIYNTISDIAAIWLTNAEGYILEVMVLPQYAERMKRKNVVQGVKWCEEDIGTNAITLSLLHNRPIQTVGAEHYCLGHQITMCSAAPIHNERGDIIGCLNISCENASFSNHILSAVTMGAYSIEKQIEVLMVHDLVNKTFDSIEEGMLITDPEFNIIKANKNVARLLKTPEHSILGLNAQTLLRDIDFTSLSKDNITMKQSDFCFYVKNHKVHCIGSIYPLQSVGKKKNIAIVFNGEKQVNQFASKLVGHKANYTFDDIITQNEKMKLVIEKARKISKMNCNLLITGESGTGKDLFAQAVHNESNRADGPFVAVNCAAIPRELVESELFGYEKGAFTGAANAGMPGKFELANGGTLFLDEIGEMPIEIQSKLLRFLDNHKVSRLGGKYEKVLDVRLIAATNRDLTAEVENKNFRMDLFYRLNVVNLHIPSLNERKDDIQILANYFLKKLEREEKGHTLSLDEEVIRVLEGHQWNGNVRELQNLMASLYYFCEGDTITLSDLPDDKWIKIENSHAPIVEPFDIMQKKMIEEAIRKNHGNISKAAKDLMISKSTIYRKIERYGIKNM